MGIHLTKALEPGNLHLGVALSTHLGGHQITLLIGVGHPLGLAPLDFIQRRHSGIDIAVFNQGTHIAEEEGQQQRSDMGTVHVRIGHNDHFMVAQLLDVELVTDTGTQGHDQGVQLIVAIDFIGPGLLHVQHLTPHGQNRLEPGISALDGRACSGVTLDDVDFTEAGVPLVAVLQLVRHLTGFQTGLTADGFSGLSGGFTSPVGHHGLFQDGLGSGRMLLEIGGQLIRHHLIYQSADIGIAELGLGLALELGIGELDGDDGGDALPAVLAGNLVIALDDAILNAVIIQHTGKGRLEARFVHTAFGGINLVGEAEDEFVVAVVILNRHLGRGIVLPAAHIDDILMEGRLIPVAPGGKLPDTALVAHRIRDRLLAPGIGDGNVQSGGQECLFPHAGMKNLIIIFQRIEHLGIRLEGDFGTGAVGFAHDGHFLSDVAPGKPHLIDVAVFMNPNLQPLGQSVDDRRAHAVEAAGYLITAAAELTTGMEDGENDFQSGLAGLGLDIHGDTTAVISDGDGIAGVNGDGDILAIAGQSLIDGVIHDFIDQMVQARRGRGADIHTGPFPDGFQTLQNLNLLRAVFLCYFRFVRHG